MQFICMKMSVQSVVIVIGFVHLKVLHFYMNIVFAAVLCAAAWSLIRSAGEEETFALIKMILIVALLIICLFSSLQLLAGNSME